MQNLYYIEFIFSSNFIFLLFRDDVKNVYLLIIPDYLNKEMKNKTYADQDKCNA